MGHCLTLGGCATGYYSPALSWPSRGLNQERTTACEYQICKVTHPTYA